MTSSTLTEEEFFAHNKTEDDRSADHNDDLSDSYLAKPINMLANRKLTSIKNIF